MSEKAVVYIVVSIAIAALVACAREVPVTVEVVMEVTATSEAVPKVDVDQITFAEFMRKTAHFDPDGDGIFQLTDICARSSVDLDIFAHILIMFMRYGYSIAPGFEEHTAASRHWTNAELCEVTLGQMGTTAFPFAEEKTR